jgi:DedD protein
MGFFAIFKRKADAVPAATQATEAADGVAEARTRARRRLIGAVVLVAVGIIGFPLVFETQPRPIPVDIPIEIPRKDAAPPLAMPPARAASAMAAVPDPVSPQADGVITESDAGREVVLPPAASAPTARSATEPLVPATEDRAPVQQATEKPTDKPAEKPAEQSADKPRTATSDDGSRARALLEGKEPVGADASRFIVQIGAFADAGAARDVRDKIERLGLKTYTQVAQTAGGSRIRVRMGPFATRDDADKALAKAKAAGVSGVVLTL